MMLLMLLKVAESAGVSCWMRSTGWYSGSTSANNATVRARCIESIVRRCGLGRVSLDFAMLCRGGDRDQMKWNDDMWLDVQLPLHPA